MPALLTLTLTLLASASLTTAHRLPHARSALHARSPNTSRNVIVQMFEWNWESIASECTSFLGPTGYGYVQVSPPQEHIAGPQWYTDYQPTSHNIISKRGDRAQFASMVQTCNAAGVKVIADTILNHMSAQDSGTGVGGTQFSHYSYPGLQYNDFHHCGLEPNDEIVNYDNRLEVQTCQLLGLADLDTGAEKVRSALAAYANDLASLGVSGYRLDASKHMSATDLANITSRFVGKPYITQEVIYGAGEPIQPSEYVGIGDVQEFRYTTALQNAFLSGGIATLQNIPEQGWVDSSAANVFVSNHDTERNGNSLNYKSPSDTYILAHVFMLTWPFGTPTILSSYTFDDVDAGAPNSGSGTCQGSAGTNGWLCQHRNAAISGLVPFHDAVSGSLNNIVTGTNQQIAFGRGASGFVAINNDDATWARTFATSLSDGTYCDVVAGGVKSGTCTGAEYTVSEGSFQATITGRSAIALYIGAMSARPVLSHPLDSSIPAGLQSAALSGVSSGSNPPVAVPTVVSGITRVDTRRNGSNLTRALVDPSRRRRTSANAGIERRIRSA